MAPQDLNARFADFAADLDAAQMDAPRLPVLDALFSQIQAEQRVLQRRYMAVVELRSVAGRLHREGLSVTLAAEGDVLTLSVPIAGLAAFGEVMPGPGASAAAAPPCEISGALSEAGMPAVTAPAVTAPVEPISAPEIAAPEKAAAPASRKAPKYTPAEDDVIVREVVRSLRNTGQMADGIWRASSEIGRSYDSVGVRINSVLKGRISEVLGALYALKGQDAAAPAPEGPAAEPAVEAVAPPPAAVPEPSAAAPADDEGAALTAHLRHLPKRLGKAAWSRADDIALMVAYCARRRMAEIALDLGEDAGLLTARIDLLTGLHQNERGLKVARWSRRDVLAALQQGTC